MPDLSHHPLTESAREELARFLPLSIERDEVTAGLFDDGISVRLFEAEDAINRAADPDEIANKLLPLAHIDTACFVTLKNALGA